MYAVSAEGYTELANQMNSEGAPPLVQYSLEDAHRPSMSATRIDSFSLPMK